MRITTPSAPPTPERAAEWWILLNCWVWPDDMPGRPLGTPWRTFTDHDHAMAIRGAHAALEASGVVSEELVDEIWQDEARRSALVHPEREL